ncbi:hypothetical protein [Rubrivirga sp. IMCC43871]|uniref:hypothetical protein n=1 Tax=Rubrivirga sp. IMCC43871 TaxID=3391575 RepID=UPI0039900B1C
MSYRLLAAVLWIGVPAAVAQPADSLKAEAAETPEAVAADAVALAASLAAYGRRSGAAHALVAAAALLTENPPYLGRLTSEDGLPLSSGAALPLDAVALLDEAEAATDPADPIRQQIAALRDSAAAHPPPVAVRGAERGPIQYAGASDGDSDRRLAIRFRGRETARLHLIGSGASDLDYYLYDANGQLVASDEGPSDSATLFWYVPYRQRLTLRVRNRGDRQNPYHLVTN